MGFAEMLTSEMLGPLGAPQYYDYLQNIHEAGQRLLEVVNDVLDMARIESGDRELAEDLVDPLRLVQAGLDLVRPRAEQKRVRLFRETEEGLPFLWGDERCLKQMLVHLLSNAVKFTPEGGRVTLTVRRTVEGGLDFVVADTGIGMSERDLAKAMALFGQADSSLGRRFEGTGLGLPLAKGLVDAHGGAMTLASRPGEGTVVTVTLPAERSRPRPYHVERK